MDCYEQGTGMAQGWRSGESAWCYMWVLLVLPLLRGFFSGFSGFPPSKKTKIFKFQFEQDRGTA